MAANFMGGGMPNQMMQQQQQQPQQQGPASQAQQYILHNLQNSNTVQGWQAGLAIQERYANIWQMVSAIRLVQQGKGQVPLAKICDMSLNFEKQIYEGSPDKNSYMLSHREKLRSLQDKRSMGGVQIQGDLNAQAQMQAQAQAQQMMQAQFQRGNMGQQQPGQGFQHLQHQMQASPLPQQPQAPQMSMGLSNDNSQPGGQQHFPMGMPPQQNGSGAPQPAGGQAQAESQMILNLAQKFFSAAPESERNNLRTQVMAKMSPANLQHIQAQGLDPVMLYYRNMARSRLVNEKMQRAQHSQQALGMPGNPGAPSMQQQRSGNPGGMPPTTQQPNAQQGNPNFDSFLGSVGEFIGQQHQAGLIAQNQGEMVVPASGPRNATPQPLGAPGVAPNGQRPVPNPNARAQQQQQFFNAQQQQQQQMNRAAVASQAQARATAAAKAQQLGLQGQPGGMGQMPPQQSPAMPTLNTPLRTPGQQPGDPLQMNMQAGQPFGQGMDPRLAQQSQGMQGPAGTPMNPGGQPGMNTMIPASMPAAQQQQLQNLPPDKLNEVINKWNAAQATKNAIGMAGNFQNRPQGMPPGAPFNPAAAGQMFGLQPGQRLPQNMPPGMNPQQQAIFQQRMAQARMAQQGPQGLMRNGPGGIAPLEPQIMSKMDQMPIHPNILNSPAVPLPRPLPEGIKTWGQLKQFIQSAIQTGRLQPGIFDIIKGYQAAHYQQLLKDRANAGGQQAAQGGPMGHIPRPQMGPNGMAAPVAPMGQGQLPNGHQMNGGPPYTQEQIQITRARLPPGHAGATDDQIIQILSRSHNQRQEQARRAAMAANPQQGQQMAVQHSQQGMMNGPQKVLQTGPVQQSAPPQGQPAPAPASATTTPVNRAGKLNVGAQRRPQSVSPAQPANPLKRASSDDVVEVPNPNVQQQAPRSVPKQNTNQTAQKPGMRSLTDDQVAKMSPEHRQKYEQYLKQLQTNNAQRQRASGPDPESQRRATVIHQEELEIENSRKQQHPDVPMDNGTRAAVLDKLSKMASFYAGLLKVHTIWFSMTKDEEHLRRFYRARFRLARQFQDANMQHPKDTLSVRMQDLVEIEKIATTMGFELKKHQQAQGQLQGQPQGQTKANETQNRPGMPPTTAPQVLSAANLQQQQMALNQQQHHKQQPQTEVPQRSNSKGSHPPAAPTSAQPPFQFGAASPHGTPVAYGNASVTRENLQLPQKKRAKMNGAAPTSTPQTATGTGSSISNVKTASPEVAKKPKIEDIKPEVKQFNCQVEDCDRHNLGFRNQAELTQHTEQEHIAPLKNPVKFAQDSLLAALDLDENGNPKQSSTPALGTNISSKSGTSITEASSKSETPKASQNAVASKDKVETEKQKVQTAGAEDQFMNTGVNPADLFTSFVPFQSAMGGAISDANVYRSITPNDTPESSKDSGSSEPNSDITDGMNLNIDLQGMFDDDWQPFGGPSYGLVGMGDSMFNVGDVDMAEVDDKLNMFGQDLELPSAVGGQTWDDYMDPSGFDKPMSFDTSLFEMTAE